MSFDILQDKIRSKKNPTVMGLDPHPTHVPPHIVSKHVAIHGETVKAIGEAVYAFNCGLMDAVSDLVPAVKPQAAYYELLGWRGMEVLERTIRYAKNKGLFVIGDVKRGDIGSTATAYSEAWLGGIEIGGTEHPTFDCDAVTVNAYLGSDGVKPFLETCRARGKCIFVLTKTSNPSSVELQDLIAGDRLVYKVVGDLAERLGKGTEGKYGYTAVGAVVGATYPSDLHELRRRLPHTFFLVPGYGAQGGTAQDVRFAFDRYGYGAIVNSSRAISCAWQKTGQDGLDYQEAARAAVIEMRDALKHVITIA